MTSQARINANRRNANLSTGPRTAEGKARASGNALRHGLNAAAPEGGGDGDEVLSLARRLCARAEPTRAERQAAEAELYLIRTRITKSRVLEVALGRVEAELPQDQTLTPDEQLAMALVESAHELLKLDGYERKARSRRKRAFRALSE